MNNIENNFKTLNNYRPAIISCKVCKYCFEWENEIRPFCVHPSIVGKPTDLSGHPIEINLNYVCDLFEHKDIIDVIDENVDEQ